MATFLYMLGRFSFRHRFFITLSWVALLVIAGVGAAAAIAPAPSSFSMPGTEAQQAFDLLRERFPDAHHDGATARMVFKAPDGAKLTDPVFREAIANAVDGVQKGSTQVASVLDPFAAHTVGKDGSTAYANITYEVASASLTEETKQALVDTAASARDSGLAVEVGGSAVPAEPEGGTEILGIAVAALVLLITFGSLVAAGLPLVTALLGVGVGVSTIGALAHTLDLGDTTSTLAMMLGLAVGIDYALFVVTRYRAELAEGHPREEAAGRALGTAGSAVVFAGLTVVIALAGLSVVGIPVLTKMGLAAAGTVALAVLVALTLLPALLGIAGKRIIGRRARKRGPRPRRAKAMLGERWAGFVLRRPLPVLVAGVLGLGVLAVPAASLELGLPDEGSLSAESTQRKAYDILSDGFGPGFNGPLAMVVDAKGRGDVKAAAAKTIDIVKRVEGVAEVSPAAFNKAGDTATITVVPASGPGSKQTENLIGEIRAAGSEIEAQTGARALVTGQTGMKVDFSQKMSDALPPYLSLVVGLAFLLLMVVFRSVLVPLKAALGFLLSVSAALGAVVAVFQWGWLADVLGIETTGPIMSTMPIFMVGIVFGLAMDYEVFLVTRIREAYVRGESPRQAVVSGFRHGARVVTAAAVIMIAVFGGFLGATEQTVKMIGFGLAVAVFLDAFVVRMAIVPAVHALLGRTAWWLPKWLGRVLPDVDVEGEKLRAVLEDRTGPAVPSMERDLIAHRQ
ncbi:MMPL family transporter [Streptomyces sp. NPDC056470]|uniref:MMPL family transporter n=1 Tax=Streptomyces sp. NPDC056470 TaxID=3345831 RepID=UPI0036CE26CE